MTTIDLNSDLGEEVGDDAAMFAIVTSANIAGGFHAGGDDTMLGSARLAVEHRVSMGAHPSYRDRENFGRLAQDIDVTQLRADIEEQLAALRNHATAAGTRVRYLKPHGALYNRIANDPVQADVVASAARDAGLPLLGLAHTAIHAAAERHGVAFHTEAFADRAYLPDGTLAPRSLAGAVISEPSTVAARAVQMVLDGTVQAIDGSILHVQLDSLCVHGDTAGAVLLAATVRHALLDSGVELRAFA